MMNNNNNKAARKNSSDDYDINFNPSIRDAANNVKIQ